MTGGSAHGWVWLTCCGDPEFFGKEEAPFGFCHECWVKHGSPQPMGDEHD